MTIAEQILLGLALAMDCFSVSFASGLILKRFDLRTMTVMAVMFGLFQAAMPAIGWICTVAFGELINPVDHWIAFALLVFIGAKMVIDQFKKEENKVFVPTKMSVILMMSLATSIDALSVGITFTCLGMNTFAGILSPILIIGLCSVVMSIVGSVIGVALGKRFKFPAELVGGTILILIGIKVLVDHLSA